jgi:hypothetical protein
VSTFPSLPPEDRDQAASVPATVPAADAGVVRHRTERDASGRVWRFVYDPAAQDALGNGDMVRIRCTTGTARATIVVRTDWLEWPSQQLLGELDAALRLARGHGPVVGVTPATGTPPSERSIARRRLVRNVRGAAWNCVYDPSIPPPPEAPELVRVRCSAGRDRLELRLDPSWHRLGDRQIATLIEQALDARAR